MLPLYQTDTAAFSFRAIVNQPRQGRTRYNQPESTPTISVFYGIIIRMCFGDHLPAHSHAVYGEFQATIDIEKLRVLEGQLPRRALELVLDWAELHEEELLEDWRRFRNKQQPLKIDPLA